MKLNNILYNSIIFISILLLVLQCLIVLNDQTFIIQFITRIFVVINVVEITIMILAKNITAVLNENDSEKSNNNNIISIIDIIVRHYFIYLILILVYLVFNFTLFFVHYRLFLRINHIIQAIILLIIAVILILIMIKSRKIK